MHRVLVPSLLLLPFLGSCGGGEEPVEPAETAQAPPVEPAPTTPPAETPATPPEPEPVPAPQPEPPPEPAAPARTPEFDFAPGGSIADDQLGDYYVEMACAIDGQDVGTMTFALWPQHAPQTVRNFLRYCDEGFYDGLGFHRIMREFMIQGGDSTGTGKTPYGSFADEFSTDADRAHGYGVISMAHTGAPSSARAQFFVCNAETPSVWGLDGSYASFGRLVKGVATLEALSDVPVAPSARGERSQPTRKATIVSARVKQGEPERGEKVERPYAPPDLGGEPERVTVQHVLISFAGTRTEATRTKEEAEPLAQSVLERAQAGEDFEAIVRELSDDPVDPEDPTPGVYTLLNTGVRDESADRAMFQMSREMRDYQTTLIADMRAGTLTQEDFRAKLQERQTQLQRDLPMAFPRQGMATSFGDVSFGLKVGEVGMAPFDAAKSPFGWHIIKRLE